jgi:hypothetical protein
MTGGTFDGKEEAGETGTTGGTGGATDSGWNPFGGRVKDAGDISGLFEMPEFLAVEVLLDSDSESDPVAVADTIVLPSADFSYPGIKGTRVWRTVDASYLADELSGFIPDDNEGDPDAGSVYNNGGRSANVYFAFSGTPDSGQGDFLSGFNKVGIITVTISPNDVDAYNTAGIKSKR